MSTHLEKLIQRYKPEMSNRAIARAAGLYPEYLYKHKVTGGGSKRMPPTSDLQALASALGCKFQEVFLAFSRDLGYHVEGFRGDNETELVGIFRCLNDVDKSRLISIAETFRSTT